MVKKDIKNITGYKQKKKKKKHSSDLKQKTAGMEFQLLGKKWLQSRTPYFPTKQYALTN